MNIKTKDGKYIPVEQAIALVLTANKLWGKQYTADVLEEMTVPEIAELRNVLNDGIASAGGRGDEPMAEQGEVTDETKKYGETMRYDAKGINLATRKADEGYDPKKDDNLIDYNRYHREKYPNTHKRTMNLELYDDLKTKEKAREDWNRKKGGSLIDRDPNMDGATKDNTVIPKVKP